MMNDTAAQCATIPSELADFFSESKHFAVLCIINGSASPVSLRSLAWFVTTKAMSPDLQEDYEKQLRKHTRRRFDPFRRSDRINLEFDGACVVTTIGQMNFFKWIIESGLWAYVLSNRAKVMAEAARRPAGMKACQYAGFQAPPTGFCHVPDRRVVVFD